MENKIIIGLVGKIASGKGTLAKYLEKEHQATTHRLSTMLRDILQRLDLDITRDHMQTLSTILRQNFGEDIMARVIASDVSKDPNSIVVVDGVRRQADIAFLKDMPGFCLISIDADPEIRYGRLVQRTENQGDSQKSYEEFLADEQKEADAEIPVVMEAANFKINNNGTFEDLNVKAEDIISQLRNN